MSREEKGGFTAEPFGPEQDAAKTRAALAKALDVDAPTMGAAYGLKQFERDEKRRLISLASLPTWPNGPETGHGIGHHLSRMLGGGIHPGCLVGVGADSAKAGKTLFVMQVADGLALRSAELVRSTPSLDPLTPVWIMSEMSAQALTWRTLARWTGYEATIFRAGASASDLPNIGHEKADQAQRAARAALSDSLLAVARQDFMRRHATRCSGSEAICEARGLIQTWKTQLEQAHRREVCPIVVIDPIQRWQDHGKTEVEALNELVETLSTVAQEDGWCVLLTSDTTKTTATGGNGQDTKNEREQGAAAFRGSYKLQHLLDVALFLRRQEQEDRTEAVVVFNRWGASTKGDGWPTFRVDFPLMRFTPGDGQPSRGGIYA